MAGSGAAATDQTRRSERKLDIEQDGVTRALTCADKDSGWPRRRSNWTALRRVITGRGQF